MKLSIASFKRTMADVTTLSKSLSKAKMKFEEQMQKAQTNHGGLAGRPNLSRMGPGDPEILKAFKFLCGLVFFVSDFAQLLVTCDAMFHFIH